MPPPLRLRRQPAHVAVTAEGNEFGKPVAGLADRIRPRETDGVEAEGQGPLADLGPCIQWLVLPLLRLRSSSTEAAGAA